MQPLYRFAACCLYALALTAGAVGQDAIPDPRPRSAVVDTTGTLAVADVGTIDSLAARARSGGELVVVVIDSTGGVAARAFATQLFNRWRLDTRERSRGVILLAAIRDRKAEIVLGDGYPAAATQVTDRIMRDVVVARFKAGRPREALVDGARALVDQLVLEKPAAPAETRAAEPLPLVAPPPTAPPAPPSGLVAQATQLASERPLPVAGGIGGALLGGVAMTRRYLRRRPRTCPACATAMVRLDETADDAHLSGGEKTEERLGSVDYDVWACPACRHTLKLRYGALFTRYASCPKCNARALRSESHTVTPATTSRTGIARVDEKCAHCRYSHSYTRTIPRVEERTSSSSSSRSGGSSSGSGSSGSW